LNCIKSFPPSLRLLVANVVHVVRFAAEVIVTVAQVHALVSLVLGICVEGGIIGDT
jgi:hypothetical protein